MQIEEHKPLSSFTTIGLGGPARWYISCTTRDEVKEALQWAKTRSQPIFILAGGSNSLIADEGFLGLVIHLNLKGTQWQDKGIVTVAAGESWDEFVEQSVARGFSGIECLSGIPGSVGSTPIQNVGAYGQEVRDTIAYVEALDRTTLESVKISNIDCDFSYRMSRFKNQDRDRFVILSVTFKLNVDGVTKITYPELKNMILTQIRASESCLSQLERLRLIRETVIQIRARKGMVVRKEDPDSRSLGSFFMNPIVSSTDKDRILALATAEKLLPAPQVFPAENQCWKIPAAWLIEQAGIKKGETLGGAAVSSKHTLALINHHYATTKDILELAESIQQRVFKKFGIKLQQEPEFISIR